MKVLTIKQPWAALIINGYKKYEFRSWKTNYRGKILIHAGMGCDKDRIKLYTDYNLDYQYGYIIGEARLLDCIKVDDKFNNELVSMNKNIYGISNHVNDYAWKLVDIIKYDKPIPVKGKLGLWNYDIN